MRSRVPVNTVKGNLNADTRKNVLFVNTVLRLKIARYIHRLAQTKSLSLNAGNCIVANFLIDKKALSREFDKLVSQFMMQELDYDCRVDSRKVYLIPLLCFPLKSYN